MSNEEKILLIKLILVAIKKKYGVHCIEMENI